MVHRGAAFFIHNSPTLQGKSRGKAKTFHPDEESLSKRNFFRGGASSGEPITIEPWACFLKPAVCLSGQCMAISDVIHSIQQAFPAFRALQQKSPGLVIRCAHVTDENHAAALQLQLAYRRRRCKRRSAFILCGVNGLPPLSKVFSSKLCHFIRPSQLR